MTAVAALAGLLSAVRPFLDQDYHAPTKTLSPGVSMRQWLDLEEAAGTATEVVDRAAESSRLRAEFRASHGLKP